MGSSPLSRKSRWALLACVGLAVLVGACGSPPATAPPSAQSAATPAPSPAPAAAPAPVAAPKSWGKVKMAQSITNLSFAPGYVAQQLGFFKDEGVEMEFIQVGGGGEAVTALTGKSVEFAYVAGTNITIAHSKGANLVINVATSLSKPTLDVIIRKEIVAAKNLKPSLPFNQRMQALKGTRFGITSPGSASDTFVRLYANIAGMNPEKDLEIVGIGTVAALQVAFEKNQIQAFHVSPPVPQQLEAAGHGTVIISPTAGDIPGLEDVIYDGVATRAELIKEQPDMVRAVARAMARANNFILDHTTESIKALQTALNRMDPKLVEMGLKAMIKAFPRDAIVGEIAWQNQVKLDLDQKLIKEKVDTKAGVMWTNEFIKDVKGKSK